MSRSKRQHLRTFRSLIPPALFGCAIFLLPDSPVRGSQLTNLQTVFVIVMENKDWDMIQGNPDCPYINHVLLPMASHAQRYFTPNDLHPSEPNYLWLESGTNFGILDDELPAINHIGSTNHLATLLEGAGISWKTYQESYKAGDNPLIDHDPYRAHHNPFVYFDDVVTNSTRLSQHVRPYSELGSDLQKQAVARYNFIVPNVTNDMHSLADGSSSKEKQGDDWLARELPGILASAAYTNKGVIFIVWDEGKNNNPIGLVVLSPLAKGRGYSNDISYTHSSLLRTVQEIFRVEPLLGDAANATNLSDLFQGTSVAASLILTNDLPRLTLSGVVAGTTNVIQTSSNLVDWVTLSTNVATSDSLVFTDAPGANDQQRFYRALQPQ
jgi:phosphatidylinositol-3-phosphatase